MDTPLHYASTQSNIDVIQLLIEHGADINKENERKQTPLHWAPVSISSCIMPV